MQYSCEEPWLTSRSWLRQVTGWLLFYVCSGHCLARCAYRMANHQSAQNKHHTRALASKCFRRGSDFPTLPGAANEVWPAEGQKGTVSLALLPSDPSDETGHRACSAQALSRALSLGCPSMKKIYRIALASNSCMDNLSVRLQVGNYLASALRDAGVNGTYLKLRRSMGREAGCLLLISPSPTLKRGVNRVASVIRQ